MALPDAVTWIACWNNSSISILGSRRVSSFLHPVDVGADQVHAEQEALLKANFASKAKSAQRGLTERLRAQRFVCAPIANTCNSRPFGRQVLRISGSQTGIHFGNT